MSIWCWMDFPNRTSTIRRQGRWWSSVFSVPYHYDPAKSYPLVLFIQDEYSCRPRHDEPLLLSSLGGVVLAEPSEQAKHMNVSFWFPPISMPLPTVVLRRRRIWTSRWICSIRCRHYTTSMQSGSISPDNRWVQWRHSLWMKSIRIASAASLLIAGILESTVGIRHETEKFMVCRFRRRYRHNAASSYLRLRSRESGCQSYTFTLRRSCSTKEFQRLPLHRVTSSSLF